MWWSPADRVRRRRAAIRLLQSREHDHRPICCEWSSPEDEGREPSPQELEAAWTADLPRAETWTPLPLEADRSREAGPERVQVGHELGIVAAAVAAGLVLLLKEVPATASAPVTSPRAPTADPTGS